MREMTPRLSLVVCTRNRAALLARTLKVLSTLHCRQPWELVFVDNASTDETPATLRAWSQTAPVPTRIVSEPRAGLGRARNAGIAASTGDVLFFTDDDCYPDATLPDAVLDFFQEHASVALVGGKVVLYDPSDARVGIRGGEDRQLVSPGTFVPAGFIIGANMAARRKDSEAVGSFDDALGGGTPWPCEDIDLAARLLSSGRSIAYEPAIVVRHHHGRRTSEDVSRIRAAYAGGRGAYHAKCLLRSNARRACARHLARTLLTWGYWRDWRSALGEGLGALTYIIRAPGPPARAGELGD